MSMSDTIPVERGWLLIMTDLGLDPATVLRRALLPEDLFTREKAKLSVPEYFRLWTVFADEIDDPGFPIKLGESMSTEAFHPMIFAALCSPNMATAARRIATYKRLIVPMTVTVRDEGDHLYIQKKWDADESTVPLSLIATDLVLLTRIARVGTRRRVNPIRVVAPHPLDPIDDYTRFFGVRPEIGLAHGVSFSAADARRPFVTANESLWKTFEPSLQRQLLRVNEEAALSKRVQSLLLEGLPSGEVSINQTARRLGVSGRTLQRRLREEGVSFKGLVRQTREKLAQHYLARTELSYSEIAFLLGFEEPSSFFRAFRLWTGRTPESTRVAARG